MFKRFTNFNDANVACGEWNTTYSAGRAAGMGFLRYWAHTHEIPPGFESSIDGHLRDARGEVVPVRSEEECFQKCGLKFMPPEERDERAQAWEQYFRMGARAVR